MTTTDEAWVADAVKAVAAVEGAHKVSYTIGRVVPDDYKPGDPVPAGPARWSCTCGQSATAGREDAYNHLREMTARAVAQVLSEKGTADAV